jgi:ribosomal protein S18 acetylase RimI-like enzyme
LGRVQSHCVRFETLASFSFPGYIAHILNATDPFDRGHRERSLESIMDHPLSLELTMRPARVADEAFLLELRKNTMERYLEGAGEPIDEETHLRRIRSHFSDAKIICQADERIGLIKTHLSSTEWAISQLQVVPALQGKGVGTEVIRRVIEQADRDSLPVTLCVLRNNPAIRLYERLGFRVVLQNDVELSLVRPCLAPAGRRQA